jgi:hypothetical protein
LRRTRRPTSLEIRKLIVKLAKETGWGYTRILGELKKLGIRSISKNTVKRILKEAGLDPGPQRGEGTWDEFLKQHAASLWQCDSGAPANSGARIHERSLRPMTAVADGRIQRKMWSVRIGSTSQFPRLAAALLISRRRT